MRVEKSDFITLKQKITTKKAKLCIIGLGYVGLPKASAFAKKGYLVYGYDTNALRIKKLHKGIKYVTGINPKNILNLIKKKKFLPAQGKEIIKEADVIIICVPTPLRKVKIPDISHIVKSGKMISQHLRSNQLVILESTSYPSTTRDVLLPILKKSGLKEEKNFFLCFSPERINPGDKKFTVSNIPKIVGGLSNKSGRLAKILYSQIIKKVIQVSDPETAETAKIMENTFRLVNIALANEFAILCSKLGISIWEVIEAAKTKPFGFMPFYPGPGIGGHCIPCDPVHLSWKAKKLGFKTKMIDLASYINHFMPEYVIQRIKKALGNIKKTKILILGVTYKKDIKDLRESPALDIIEKLQKKKIEVDYYDPLIPYIKTGSINMKRIILSSKKIKQYNCIILVTDHTKLNYKFIQKSAKLIFDTRNVYRGNYDNVTKL